MSHAPDIVSIEFLKIKTTFSLNPAASRHEEDVDLSLALLSLFPLQLVRADKQRGSGGGFLLAFIPSTICYVEKLLMTRTAQRCTEVYD